jgi:hypothetical protein
MSTTRLPSATDTPARPHRAVVAGRVAAVLLTCTAAFQLALAAGAPWGAAAWGGKWSGVLPVGLRVVGFVAALIYLVLALVALGRLASRRTRRWVLRVFAVYSLLGVALNLASPSLIETAIWVPVTLGLTMSLWLAGT